MTLDRRQLMVLAGASTLNVPAIAKPARTITKTLNVRDYGARGDGVADDTAAFNRATRATEQWSTDLEVSILVPAGIYKILGTVYLRKGQSLLGEGQSSQIDARGAVGSTFIMGSSEALGRKGQDPGGSPVRIADLRTLGGSPHHGLIYTAVAGFSVSGLFMTACGIGLELEGNDGILSDIYVDQCLNGIVVRNAQSIVISNSIWYSANFGLSIGSNVRAMSVTNCVFSFSRFAPVNFEDGATMAQALSFTGCVFINNEQYDTFLGCIHSRASSVDASFNGCIFRNWPRHAINHASGRAVSLRFAACTFDANRASDDHNQTSTAGGIVTGPDGDFHFSDCQFIALMAPLTTIGSALKRLAFQGGTISGMDGPRFAAKGSIVPGSLSVRDLEGVARSVRTPQGIAHVIPNIDGVDWQFCLSGWIMQSGRRKPISREWIVAGQAGDAIEIEDTGGSHASTPVIAIEVDRSAAPRVNEVTIHANAMRLGGELPYVRLNTL